MSETDTNRSSERLDAATAARLSKLRANTVDVTRLLAELQAGVGPRPEPKVAPPPAPVPLPPVPQAPSKKKPVKVESKPAVKATRDVKRPIKASIKAAPSPALASAPATVAKPLPERKRPDINPASVYRLRRIRMAAASVVLIVSLFVSLRVWSARPVVPSMTFIASVHDDLIALRAPVARVDSIDAANASLAASASGLPIIPDVTDLAHVTACATRTMNGKRVACVMLKDQAGWPVTIVVADARDVRILPDAPTMKYDGATYQMQSNDGLTMISAVRGKKWICLISAAPAQRLVKLASQSRF